MSVQKALEGYIQATNTHVFENVSKFVAPEAVYWFTKKECIGLKEIEEYFINSWNLIKDEVYSISNVNWISMDEKSATCLYTYHWEGYYNGDLIKGFGNATNVFIIINNEWKLIHEHLSSLT
ncbi:nuclear transport factor 2 family protein [Neobacillus sp. PS3-34]|uniref:YybH family protein n=1 Tax=Neobacillus sp. PS3-34 TaxID=3070678 RepID=UPI0027E1BE15|nr:nuclear transport factor 2 family protein [Neobacillus sp. PS3-34]WML50061.1 nuclear transport factor 2 family protein [Neobacillus sp. PS3-34]